MLLRRLQPFQPYVYAIMRIVIGLMFSFHGMQKIFGVLSDHQPAMFSQMWVGGVIELVCGLMIAVGLYSSIAAFLASGTMAVAYIQFHWGFQFDQNIIPTINKGELALTYAFVFLFIACNGPGIWSITKRD